MRTLTVLILLASSLLALGQPAPAPELREQLKGAKGKKRVDLLADLSWTEVWGDAELGYTLAKEGEGLADKIGYDIGEARCKAMIGMSILFQGHSPEALEYLLESLPELKKEEDPFWMFTVYSALGYVDWDQGEYKKAMGYFRQAQPYPDLMQNSNAQISVLSDLGGCYLHLGNTDSALHYISQAFVKAEVTRLFTDFVGFTEITEDWSAEEVVWEINTCFSEFDRIAAKYNIEKIKTIGDSYMCARGIPTPSNTHVIDTIKAALEFRAFIQQRIDKLKKDGREAFQIRIGIHTGPVVAGIVGVKKFQYDIWGSTVNTASRMESHGESGKVNISEATYSRVSGDPGFMFTKRETLEVKGKGSMQMYFVDAVEIEALL